MTMSPKKKDYGHHNYPFERIETAITFLKKEGYRKIGIAGLSTTGMVALAAASLIHDITLTIALSPSDFIMEGFYQDNKDGMHERPGDNESTLTWRGKPLPYLPYAYRHPDYWKKIEADSKKYGDMVVSRPMFDESEEKHPLKEEEKIKVENIRGHIVFAGAEDDVLWDTCRYIRRMMERLEDKKHSCTYEAVLRKHGTHFVLPEGMMKKLAPKWLIDFFVVWAFKEAKGFKKECRETRIAIDQCIANAIARW
jgi:acetyl esterase/lipase